MRRSPSEQAERLRTMGYWIASGPLIVFGILGSMTIGQPFVIVGLAMVVLGPFRHRRLVFWPPMLAVIASNVTFWTISPLYCSATSPAWARPGRPPARA